MSLNETSLEKKLAVVTNSQDSIQGLSLWILHHKTHYKRIIHIWFNCFTKAKSSHRLTLFYLANDVIQHAKRKGVPQFVDHFADYLKKATALCKEDQISANIERVFNIWLERSIYSEDLIEELRGLLSGKSVHLAAVSRIVAEFKLSELIERMKKTKKAEQTSASKLECLVNCKVDATSGEVLNKLKDKTHGEQFSRDFDDATKCLEAVINSLEKEVHTRSDLIENLEKSEIFYETQKEEAKTVVDAYKNFGLRVRNVWRKLEESRSSLPSPLPSPPRDAPSPTNSDDGPNLPQMGVFATDVNPLIRGLVFPSAANQTTSSLDQRLSSLMHNMSHVKDSQVSDSNDLNINKNSQSIQIPAISSNNDNNNYANINNNNNHWMNKNTMSDQNLNANYQNESLYSSHQPNLNHSQAMYDYNYSQPMHDINRHQTTGGDIQHIQPLVSTRGQQIGPQLSALPPIVSSNMMSLFHDYSSVQPSENMEPADMDLGNSDDEDLRPQQTHRTIKVIDTRRNSTEPQLPEFNMTNNNDRLYANNNHMTNSNSVGDNRVPQYMPSFPALKSVARMPVRPSLNSVVQQTHPYPPPHTSHPNIQTSHWRTPRSAVVAAQHSYSPMNAPPPPLNRNQHNWRSHNNNNNNRNNRKARY
ncbi:unnamed protein product [Medioppia subpectinata]|uniref:Regulation of nuclear pre-mRNA domain-containing protein 2 n=1 Tax=Medioppia subpectinata TaxID=1979941 RepID=A0A7R9PYM8_9ACAR|nr:unnamed protein product [Medioppia subpectinata]CAG2105245.1 unnamed protein product [Medioppia subpectinata]